MIASGHTAMVCLSCNHSQSASYISHFSAPNYENRGAFLFQGMVRQAIWVNHSVETNQNLLKFTKIKKLSS